MVKTFKISSKILKTKKNLRIFIPNQYRGEARVLYMHDGQNLFDRDSSYSLEIWDMAVQTQRLIDAGLIEPLLIVGIDHGKYRLDEYAPFDNKKIYETLKIDHVEPFGNLYMSFIVNELMPFIEKKFKFKHVKHNTYMAGSSMGGLISLYGGLSYNNVFGGLGIFSPSSWWNPLGLEALLKVKFPSFDQKYFVVCGENEAGTNNPKDNQKYVKTVKIIKKYLKPQVKNLYYETYEGAKHNEAFWASLVPSFLLYISKKS